MAFSNGPTIVTNGLVLSLDAADRNSYVLGPQLVTNASLLSPGDGLFVNVIRTATGSVNANNLGSAVSGSRYGITWTVTADRGSLGADLRIAGSANTSPSIGIKAVGTYSATFVALTTGAFSINGVNTGVDFDLDYVLIQELPTTWNDASGNSYNGTLTNGPIFNFNNRGTIQFDGVDDYIIGTSNFPISGDASFTISYFAIWDGASFSTDYPSGVGNNSTGVTNQGLSTTWNSGRIALDFWVNRFRDNTTLNVQTWYNVAFTKTPGLIGSTTKLYVNGQERTGAVEGTNTTPNITISPYVVGRLDASRWFNGRIANVQIYNRDLSASEIQQNYNAQKSRFGL